MLKGFRSIFRVLRSRQTFEESMSDELRFHLEQVTADLVRSGLPAGTGHAPGSDGTGQPE